MKRRILSVLLCFVMMLGMMPTMAFAEGSTSGDTAVKSIMLDTSGIQSPTANGNYLEPSSYIHFGNDGKYNWRVLDASKANNGDTNGMFLLKEDVIPNVGMAFGGSTYQGSTVQTWLKNNFETKSFTTAEQAAMLATTKTESSNSVMTYDHTWYEGSLNGDKMFLPSMPELKTYVGENGTSTGLSGTNTWWTRSKSTVSDAQGQTYMGVVFSNGGVDYKPDSTYYKYYIRPAFNLDKNKVLFTSSQYGKKDTNGALVALDDYTGNEWKLTLLDTSLDVGDSGFKSSYSGLYSTTFDKVVPGTTCYLDYENGTSTGEHISAIIADKSGKAVYYGRLTETNAGGYYYTTVTIPSDLKGGTYTLHVFKERCNDNSWQPDYAGNFKSIKMTVKGSAEAKIGGTEYETLGEAVKAAYSNDTNDVIEILSDTVTLGDETYTLKKGDSIMPYAEDWEHNRMTCGVITATSDDSVTLDVYEITGNREATSFVKFVSGEVQLKKFGVANYASGVFGKAATVTGMSGKEISVSIKDDANDEPFFVMGEYEESEDTAENGYAEDMVYVPQGATVKIGNREYTNASGENQMGITVTDGGDYVLEFGSVKLDKDEEIAAGNKMITNSGESTTDAITVTVDDNNGNSIVVPANGTVTIGDVGSGTAGTTYAAGTAGATLGITSNGYVTLTAGAATTTGDLIATFGDSVGTMSFSKTVGDAAYTVDITQKTLTVPENTTVTTGGDVQYTGEGAFTFGKDASGNGTVKVGAGASVTSKGATIIGVTGGDTTIGIYDGSIWLSDGKGQSDGKMNATIDEYTWTFNSENKKYTIDTDGALTLDEAGTVSMEGAIYFTGKAGDQFNLNIGNNAGTATIPADATVSDSDGNAITGVAAAESGNDTKVEIGEGLTLIAGKGSVTGETTVKAQVGEKTVEVAIPAGTTATIDLDSVPPVVKGLEKGESVTLGGVTYTAVDESSFPLDGGKLAKNGESAVIPGDIENDVTITLGSDTTPVVTVPSTNVGKTTVTKGSPSTVVLEKTDDEFTVDGKTYTAGSDGATFTVKDNGNITLISGSVTIGDGVEVTGKSGKAIENPTGSGEDSITVAADDKSNKDTVTVPTSGGKVLIGSIEYTTDKDNTVFEVATGKAIATLKAGKVQLDSAADNKGESITGSSGHVIKNTYTDSGKTITVETGADNTDIITVPGSGKVTINDVEYEAETGGATLVVDSTGRVTISSGSVKLDKNDGNITAGVTGAVITNPTEGKTLTVKADSTSKKDTVTVQVGGSVKVGDTTYGNASETETETDAMVIDLTKVDDKVKATITKGTATVPAGKTLITKGIEVINTGADKKNITVSADGTVTVPAGGTLDIGSAKITDVAQETTFTIGEDGNVKVKLIENKTVTINGAVYTGAGDGGGELTIDPVTGKVIGITGVINIVIDESRLTDDFSYDLVPGQSVTIGKYIYTAPESGKLGDVTIKGRGMDENEKVLNPAVVLKNAYGTVKVALSANKDTETTYTADKANTVFAMAADDKDTTKVDLLDNKATPNSALKFTDKDSHIVNGVTYQAQTVKNADEAVAYTVTYGTASVDTGDKDKDGNPIMETVNRNTVSVVSGSKVIATMTAKGTINIDSGKIGDNSFADIPFTASNSSASIIIDSSVEGTANISGNGSYLTEIKDEDGNVTGYKVTRYSGSTTTDSVVNKTEDKTAGTTATTTATVKTETRTGTDGTKTTTATVDTNTAAKIVEKAVENKSEEVVVNTGAGVTETAAGSTTEIQLPEQTVQGLSQKTEASVTIKSESAEVTLNKEAVDGLASQAGDDGYVRLVVETVKQDESAVQVDLKLVTSKGNVTDFRGGNVSVTVKLNATLAAKPVVCVYIDNFGTYHKVKGAKKADGTYTFETGHFSSYAVMAEEEADKVIAEQTANIKKLAGDLSLKARSAKTAKGNIKATLTVNEDAIKAIEDLGYTVKYKFYRSTKKSAGYKAVIEKTGKTYTNTTGKKGTRYYYKARVMIYDAQGELVTKTALTQCKYACRIWSK